MNPNIETVIIPNRSIKIAVAALIGGAYPPVSGSSSVAGSGVAVGNASGEPLLPTATSAGKALRFPQA